MAAGLRGKGAAQASLAAPEGLVLADAAAAAVARAPARAAGAGLARESGSTVSTAAPASARQKAANSRPGFLPRLGLASAAAAWRANVAYSGTVTSSSPGALEQDLVGLGAGTPGALPATATLAGADVPDMASVFRASAAPVLAGQGASPTSTAASSSPGPYPASATEPGAPRSTWSSTAAHELAEPPSGPGTARLAGREAGERAAARASSLLLHAELALASPRGLGSESSATPGAVPGQALLAAGQAASAVPVVLPDEMPLALLSNLESGASPTLAAVADQALALPLCNEDAMPLLHTARSQAPAAGAATRLGLQAADPVPQHTDRLFSGEPAGPAAVCHDSGAAQLSVGLHTERSSYAGPALRSLSSEHGSDACPAEHVAAQELLLPCQEAADAGATCVLAERLPEALPAPGGRIGLRAALAGAQHALQSHMASAAAPSSRVQAAEEAAAASREAGDGSGEAAKAGRHAPGRAPAWPRFAWAGGRARAGNRNSAPKSRSKGVAGAAEASARHAAVAAARTGQPGRRASAGAAQPRSRLRAALRQPQSCPAPATAEGAPEAAPEAGGERAAEPEAAAAAGGAERIVVKRALWAAVLARVPGRSLRPQPAGQAGAPSEPAGSPVTAACTPDEASPAAGDCAPAASPSKAPPSKPTVIIAVAAGECMSEDAGAPGLNAEPGTAAEPQRDGDTEPAQRPAGSSAGRLPRFLAIMAALPRQLRRQRAPAAASAQAKQQDRFREACSSPNGAAPHAVEHPSPVPSPMTLATCQAGLAGLARQALAAAGSQLRAAAALVRSRMAEHAAARAAARRDAAAEAAAAQVAARAAELASLQQVM